MKLPFFFKKPADDDREALLDRYRQVRAVGRELNMALVKQLPRTAVPECGKKLGIFKAGTLILNNDDEIAILYDYCLYHYRRDGKTVIDRRLANTPPPPDSMDMALLQAMRNAYYSLFRILDILPHKGAKLLDLVSGETIDLVDIGMSETGSLGIFLAGRILPLPDFNMSSGTVIPVSEAVFEDRMKPVVRKFIKTQEPGQGPKLSPALDAAFTAEIIRVALHAGGSDNVFYTDIEG